MNIKIALLATFTLIFAFPQENKDATVVKNILANDGVNGYQYSYETSNGIAAEEQGQLVSTADDDIHISAQGSYRYLGPDGVTYTVNYIADENGFQPQGAHLPTA